MKSWRRIPATREQVNIEQHDRSDTFEGYKAIPTVGAYVLVGYERRAVAMWRRDDAGAWTATTYGPGDDVALECLDLTQPMALNYEDSDLP